MKNGRPHLIPLSKSAVKILARRVKGDREHVFGRGSRGFQGWSWRRQDLDDRIVGPRPTWVLHDFRRLVSTTMHEKLGVAPHIVERILAHVGHQAGIAGVQQGRLSRREASRAGALGRLRQRDHVRRAIG